MRLGLFPAFFCLIAGLSCGLILICYNQGLEDKVFNTDTDSLEDKHTDAFFNRVWGQSHDSGIAKVASTTDTGSQQNKEEHGTVQHQAGAADQAVAGSRIKSSVQQSEDEPTKNSISARNSISEATSTGGTGGFGVNSMQRSDQRTETERERSVGFQRDNPQYADTAGRGARSEASGAAVRRGNLQALGGRQDDPADGREEEDRGRHSLRVSVKAGGQWEDATRRLPYIADDEEQEAEKQHLRVGAAGDVGEKGALVDDEDDLDVDYDLGEDSVRHDADESQAAAEAHAKRLAEQSGKSGNGDVSHKSSAQDGLRSAERIEDEQDGSEEKAVFKKLEPGGKAKASVAGFQAKEAGRDAAVAQQEPQGTEGAVGENPKKGAKGSKAPPTAKPEKKQTAEDKKFTSQMKDMLDLESNDKGGESTRMEFLSEEEANARDAEEYNEIKAYGARDEDMVTFLQVRQGPQRMPEEFRTAMVKAAREGVPLLNMDLVKSHAQQNTVIVTYANWGYYDFVLNWVSHMRRLNITNFLVGALDKQTSWGLAALGIPGFQMFPGGDGAIGLTTQEFRPNQENSHRMSRQKIALARLFTDFGIDVVLTDVDTVWLRNPTPYFHKFLNVDILVASDELTTTLNEGDEGLEMPQAVQGPLSIGVLYMRHSPATALFIRAWDDLLAGQIHRVDQLAFNTLIAKHTTPLRNPPRNPRLATGPNRAIVVGVLPVGLFMNGHTFFVQNLHKELGVRPYVVHATFQDGGVRGKRHRFREAGLWMDPPAYYDTASNFIKVVPDPVIMPLGTLTEADMIRFHVDSLNKQLAQVRAGIALAVATERILIMPKFICFCDRSWIGVERCRAPGAPDMQLPFTCPLDHVLKPTLFDDELREYGPRVDYREYSFLDNPLLPRSIQASMAVIVPAGDRLTRFQENEIPMNIPRIPVPSGSTDEDIRKIMEPHYGVRVLIFADANRTFGGFKDRSWAGVVSKRLGRLQNTWCCGKGEEEALLYGMDSRASGLVASAAA